MNYQIQRICAMNMLKELPNTKDLHYEYFCNHQFFFNCNVSNIININLLVTFYVYFQICLIRINEINQGFLFNEIFSKLLLEEQKQLQQLFLIMISVFVVNELNTNSNVCCKDYCKQHNINCARTYSAKVILASVTSSTVSVHYSRSLSTSFFWQNYDFHSLYTLHS